eukprot:Ihof_evm22s3 gene=Ihof_evmTU22s3
MHSMQAIQVMQKATLWHKSLGDLIRGLRSNKGNEAQYLAEVLTEIKEELRSESATTKAVAISKLTYLHMLGYDVSFASFKTVEVMSQARFSQKRIGYLAASQTFTDTTDVLMLTTNMLKKDILSQNQYEAGLALNGLSNFVTPDLARDLANDLMSVLTSSRSYVRKKALLAMYKVVLCYPDALRPYFLRLKDKLEDNELGVQSAAVNVICELARKNPKNYLSLAPPLFRMLGSHNNWMMIKVIKLFASLMPYEPRLGKKLLEPLTNIINTTSAMSLLYEAISTVIEGMPGHALSIQLCVSKLRLFIEDPDQNLKYLGLVQLAKICKIQPKAALEYKELVLACLEDPDETIRMRALELLPVMASSKSVPDIVKRLLVTMEKMTSQEYKDEIICQMISMCSHDNYKHIANFEWYFDVLISLVHLENTAEGPVVANQLLDVVIRVKNVRQYAVQKLVDILQSATIPGKGPSNGMVDALYAAAHLVGEYYDLLERPQDVLLSLVHHDVINLPHNVQASFLQNAFKIYSKMSAIKFGDFNDISTMLLDKVTVFTESPYMEVQERACMLRQVILLIQSLDGTDPRVGMELLSLFEGELNPVASRAQKKVPVPDNLKLDKWIYDPPSSSESEHEIPDDMYSQSIASPIRREYVEDPVDTERRREERRRQIASNPHYLRSGNPNRATLLLSKDNDVDVDDIPIERLVLGMDIDIGLEDQSERKKSRRNRRREENEAALPVQHYEVAAVEDMPDGAVYSSSPSDSDNEIDPHKALNINLDEPLNDGDILPVRTHHVVKPQEPIREHRHRSRRDKEEKERSDRLISSESKHESKHRHKTHHRTHGDKTVHHSSHGDKTIETRSHKERERKKGGDKLGSVDRKKDKERERERGRERERERETETETERVHKHKERGKKHRKDRREREERDLIGEEIDEKRDMYESLKDISKPDLSQPDDNSLSARLDIPQLGEAELDGWMSAEAERIKALPRKADNEPFNYRLAQQNDDISILYDWAFGDDGQSFYLYTSVENNSAVAFSGICQKINAENATVVSSNVSDDSSIIFDLGLGEIREIHTKINITSGLWPMELECIFLYKRDKNEPIPLELPFHVNLAAFEFLVRVNIQSKEYSELLTGGNLCPVQKRVVKAVDGYDGIIDQLCSHMNIVERINNLTSLYARTMQGHNVCLLVRDLE